MNNNRRDLHAAEKALADALTALAAAVEAQARHYDRPNLHAHKFAAVELAAVSAAAACLAANAARIMADR